MHGQEGIFTQSEKKSDNTVLHSWGVVFTSCKNLLKLHVRDSVRRTLC